MHICIFVQLIEGMAVFLKADQRGPFLKRARRNASLAPSTTLATHNHNNGSVKAQGETSGGHQVPAIRCAFCDATAVRPTAARCGHVACKAVRMAV